MLEKIARTKKEIVLSSGMSSFAELDETIGFINGFGNKLSLLQCTTMYPAPAQAIGLNVIPEMKQRYGIPVGLSDHSGSIFPSIAAVALGAEIIEVHATFDKRMFGPDASASLTMDELKQLVAGIESIRISLENKIDKNENGQYQQMRAMFGKSLAVNRALPAGHSITFEDLEGKKPYTAGIPAHDFRSVLGRKLRVAKAKFEFLQSEDLI